MTHAVQVKSPSGWLWLTQVGEWTTDIYQAGKWDSFDVATLLAAELGGHVRRIGIVPIYEQGEPRNG